MMIVSKELNFCAGHRLVDYVGPCANLHGHNYIVEITVSGDVDPKTGFVMDFQGFKRVQNWIDLNLDHTLILNAADELLTLTMVNSDGISVSLSEVCGRLFLMPCNPTAENLATLIAKEAHRLLPVNVHSVTVWETLKCEATWIAW